MNIDKNQLALAQLALLIFAAMAIMSRSSLMPWVITILALALSFSLGTALAMLNKAQVNESNSSEQNNSAVLGTHLGGVICYAITISFIFHYLT